MTKDRYSGYSEKTAGTMRRQSCRMTADGKKTKLENPVVIILDDLDFSWTKSEIKTFLHRWNEGWFLYELAEMLRPDLDPVDARDEAMLLALHLYRKGKTDRVPER